jgi:hypothetical protein
MPNTFMDIAKKLDILVDKHMNPILDITVDTQNQKYSSTHHLS